VTPTRIERQIDDLIRRLEVGETIEYERETVLAGWNFVADSLETQRTEDERQLAGAEQAAAVR
jgi:hypothetical protein